MWLPLLLLNLSLLHLIKMTRGTEKKLVQTFSKFETIAKLVTKACDPVNPTLEKSLAKNRDNLDQVFIELCHDHKLYRSDVNDDAFNAKDDDEKDKFFYNDSWLQGLEDHYCELVDKSDDKLELLNIKHAGGFEIKPDTEI